MFLVCARIWVYGSDLWDRYWYDLNMHVFIKDPAWFVYTWVNSVNVHSVPNRFALFWKGMFNQSYEYITFTGVNANINISSTYIITYISYIHWWSCFNPPKITCSNLWLKPTVLPKRCSHKEQISPLTSWFLIFSCPHMWGSILPSYHVPQIPKPKTHVQ